MIVYITPPHHRRAVLEFLHSVKSPPSSVENHCSLAVIIIATVDRIHMPSTTPTPVKYLFTLLLSI